MSALVRVVSPAGHPPHRHEGMVICRDHLRQLDSADDPPVEEVSVDRAAFLGECCLMCMTVAVPGRLCENADCRRPLDPSWPAVYCCNECAFEDA
jgi:hypothetical protein